MQFQETWKYQIFLILCFLGVKLMIVDKPQIPTNTPFYDRLYEPLEVFWHTSLKAGTCSYTLCTHPISKMYHCGLPSLPKRPIFSWPVFCHFLLDISLAGSHIIASLCDLMHQLSSSSIPAFLYIHWCQYIIGICWFYYINGHCFKFATGHK